MSCDSEYTLWTIFKNTLWLQTLVQGVKGRPRVSTLANQIAMKQQNNDRETKRHIFTLSLFFTLSLSLSLSVSLCLSPCLSVCVSLHGPGGPGGESVYGGFEVLLSSRQVTNLAAAITHHTFSPQVWQFVRIWSVFKVLACLSPSRLGLSLSPQRTATGNCTRWRFGQDVVVSI